MCLIGIVGRPVVSWGVLGCLGCPGVIRLTDGALSAVSVGAVVHNDQELFRAPTERAESCRKSRKLWKKSGIYKNVKISGTKA